MTDNAAPEGALSVDQAIEAVGLLSEAPAPKQPDVAEAAEVQEAPDQIEAPESDDPPALEADDTGEAPSEEGEPKPLDPPKHFDAEDKAWFAELTPEAQAKVLKQEAKRESVLQKARTAAEQAAQRANTQSASVEALAQGLSQFLPQAIQKFQSKWAGVDWALAAQQMEPRSYQAARAEAEADAANVQRLQTAHQQAQAEAARLEQQREYAALPEVAPDLWDAVADKPNMARVDEMTAYLRKLGAPEPRITGLTAFESALAYKAMLYDKAQAGLANRQPATPTPKAGTRTIAARPGAPQSPNRTATQLRNRLNQTGSIDDAVALLNARG